jgi:hypothetical protein
VTQRDNSQAELSDKTPEWGTPEYGRYVQELVRRAIIYEAAREEAESEALKSYRELVLGSGIDLAAVRRAKDREHQLKVDALESDANRATQEHMQFCTLLDALAAPSDGGFGDAHDFRTISVRPQPL